MEFLYPEFTPCQARVTVVDSGLCCICVTSFERLLTPLLVDFDAKKMPQTFRIKSLRIEEKNAHGVFVKVDDAALWTGHGKGVGSIPVCPSCAFVALVKKTQSWEQHWSHLCHRNWTLFTSDFHFYLLPLLFLLLPFSLPPPPPLPPPFFFFFLLLFSFFLFSFLSCCLFGEVHGILPSSFLWHTDAIHTVCLRKKGFLPRSLP